MWKNILEWVGYLFRQKEATEQNTTAIEKLQDTADSSAVSMRQLAMELIRTRENEAHEREKLALRLELLLAQRGIVPAISKPEPDRDDLLRQIEELKRELAELRQQNETKKIE